MKHAIGGRVRNWLTAAERTDLLVSDVDIPDELYHEVLTEAKEQHPDEPPDLLEDRARYRILTHPEWTPMAKDSSGLTEAKDSPVPVLYRMMGAAAESARGAASSATIAAFESSKALQSAERAKLAEERTTISRQYANTASEQAQRFSQVASAALEKYSRIAKRQMIIKFIIIALLLLGLALLVTRPAHGQEKPRVIEAQGNEALRNVAQKPPESPPPLTADQKFRVRDLQVKYTDLRLQMAKLELDKMKLERQITDVLSTINGLAFDIARESKVATDNWNLDIDTLTWVKRK